MIKNKPGQIKATQVIVILILGVSLFACLGSNQITDLPDDQGIIEETVAATEDLPPEVTPSSDIYAVVGVSPDEHLNLYLTPTNSAEIVGRIPPFGTGLRPISNIQIRDDASWVQIQYEDQVGWVDYSYLAEQHGFMPAELVKLGQEVLIALEDYQYDQLKGFIHPSICLRFSPYSYLNTVNRIICKSDLAAESLSTDDHLWGHYDGTGNPITLTFNAYHERFIYDQDYLSSPVIGYNLEVSAGNSINNIQELYPDGMMIEYHFPEIDPQYGGMDWRSIRLVFVQQGAKWYLAAIIHGEWTI
jgi:hypothetical protein